MATIVYGIVVISSISTIVSTLSKYNPTVCNCEYCCTFTKHVGCAMSTIKLSSIFKTPASNVIIGDSNQTGYDTVDNAILGLSTDITTVSGELGYNYTPQIVYVNPDLPEKEGKSYSSWTNADTYIQSKSPSANNRWAIHLSGVVSESIVVREYVSIIGKPNTTIITGAVSSSVFYTSGMDTTKSRVINCEVTNLATSSPMEFIQFENCKLSGSSATTGFIQLFNGSVVSGDYTSLLVFQLFKVMVVGGVLNKNMFALNSELYDNYTLTGGELSSCLVRNQGSAQVSLADDLSLDRCNVDFGFDTSNVQVTMTQCCFDGSPSFNISTGGSLFTYNCMSGFSVTGDTDSWFNYGSLYNNKTSGLVFSDLQSVADYLAFGKGLVSTINSSSGAIELDIKYKVIKTTLTEDITNISYTNRPDSSDATYVDWFIRQDSVTNYSINFGDIKFSNGEPPELSTSHGLEYRLRLLFVGTDIYCITTDKCLMSKAELLATRSKIDPNTITPLRDATTNVLDEDLSTSDVVNYNLDEHEYRFSNTRNLMDVELIVNVNQGEGWPSDSNIDFYYIPPGKTDTSEYIKFATHNYPGMVDWVDYSITKSLPGDYVKADGVYIIFTGNNIEGGWATFNIFRAFATVDLS